MNLFWPLFSILNWMGTFGMFFRDLEIVSHYRARNLTVNGNTVLGNDFPMGEGWYRLMLRFNIVVTIGTGSGPITEGELLVIKSISLKTGAGEIIVNSMPGRAMYKIAITKANATPRKDAIAAASATYSVDIPIYFVDDRMIRPEDTILDTGRYSAGSLVLEITMGGVADLFTTIGTSSVTFNLDAEIERTKGMIPEPAEGTLGGKPLFHAVYGVFQNVDANSATAIEIDRSPDLGYKRLFAHASSNGSAGVPFSGANADDVQSLESIVDQSGNIVQERIHEMIQNQNKNDYSLESVVAGITIFDMVRDGSVNSSLYPGNRSRLQYKWTNKAGVAANDFVTLAYEGVRALK